DDPLLLDALEVVIHPDRDRAAEGDVDAARRRPQPGQQPHVVRAQDEDADGADERQVLAPVRTDPLLEQSDNRTNPVLDDDLERPGVLDAEGRAYDERQNCTPR